MSSGSSPLPAAPSNARLPFHQFSRKSEFDTVWAAARAGEKHVRHPVAASSHSRQQPSGAAADAKADCAAAAAVSHASRASSASPTKQYFRGGSIRPGSSGLEVLAALIKEAFHAETNLGKYLRSMMIPSTTTTPSVDAEPQTKSGNILPCTSPVFPDPSEPVTAQSPRVRRRVQMKRVSRQLLALQIGTLSFQAAGRPPAAAAAARVGAPMTAAQQRSVKRLERKVVRLVRVVSSVQLDASCGRKAASVLEMLGDLAKREVSSQYDGGPISAEARHLAPRRIQPDRVDLPPPGRAGSFAPDEYLREDVRASFRDPELLRVRSSSAPPPRARHHVDPGREVELLECLDLAGMLEFALDADIDARLVSGMFPVHKSADRDRLVSNRRPRNAVEQRIGAAAELFPHGCMFTELLVGARARVRGSGDDLPDFYHTVKVSSARARSNAFGRPVRFRDVAHLAAARRLRE